MMPTTPVSTPLIILGGGYTGKEIYRQALKMERPLYMTSRNPDFRLQSFPQNVRIGFDLEKPKTWDSLPEKGDVIWTFPATPLDKVKTFVQERRGIFLRLILIGSTSVYLTDSIDGVTTVDENSPLDLTDPRVEGEEFLRKTMGAMILRSAGIYGPGRNPFEWVRRGRLNNAHQFLNLIHLEDLAAISLLALAKGVPGEVYNISDGKVWQTAELLKRAGLRPDILSSPLPARQKRGKKVSNQKLLQQLHYAFKYPDLYEALDKMS